jgi:hypothetical protein
VRVVVFCAVGDYPLVIGSWSGALGNQQCRNVVMAVVLRHAPLPRQVRRYTTRAAALGSRSLELGVQTAVQLEILKSLTGP